MEITQLFLASDAALRIVINRLAPVDLDKEGPEQWARTANPTIRDVLKAQAYDEAWIPGVLAGASSSDGDEFRDRDLLGDDPIAAYNALNDTATAAVTAGVDPNTVVRFTTGDVPALEGLKYLSVYRAFHAWLIAKRLGIPFRLSPEIIAGMNAHVIPVVEEYRSNGVFPPAIQPPADADDQTLLLCAVGFWIP
ncbi:hypothetical protein [Arthrobacter cryoconiti]|uniref:Uncharacterized protein n=1 Tax=Arthrobacter cryoconiti TaxID=748907 RepID=A0ABV8QYL2_9MICC|nr:hypothetical protein [Arthrobacter cryoconiti]MCC9067601.1 hypothetical protein [Arthrobacter cryoconiti]